MLVYRKFTIWLWLTVCHGKSPFLIGEPSINGPAINGQTVSHNQRVIHPRFFMAKFAIQVTWKSNDPECKKTLRPVKVHSHLVFCDYWLGSSRWNTMGLPMGVLPNLWPVGGKSEQCTLIWGEPIFEQSHRWCELCVVRCALRCQLAIPKLASVETTSWMWLGMVLQYCSDPCKNVSKHVKTTKMRKISQLMD